MSKTKIVIMSAVTCNYSQPGFPGRFFLVYFFWRDLRQGIYDTILTKQIKLVNCKEFNIQDTARLPWDSACVFSY
jgi:hypothetical protein